MNVNKNFSESVSPSKKAKKGRRYSSIFDLTQKKGNFEIVKLTYFENWFNSQE